jgi:hypothetical protein
MFIRAFRTKRILSFYKKMKAFVGNLPDDPDNEPDSARYTRGRVRPPMDAAIELISPQSRDPLIGVLDYIVGASILGRLSTTLRAMLDASLVHRK